MSPRPAVSLTFLGAADTVTGSRTLVTVGSERWLIDCGLFQGQKEIRDRNWSRFTPEPETLSGIILTHAHLDHSGYLPKIVREGYRGRIVSTKGTADLCQILLRDAAKLEEEGASFANRTGYSNHKPALPLFTSDDAELALGRFEARERREWIDLSKAVKVRFLRAGHIIGASIVQLAIDTGKGERILTFTGDLGNDRSYLLRGPERITHTDALVIESTYGDRDQERTSGLDAFAEIVKRTAKRGGVLVVPAFAVGRAQEVTYMLRLLEDRGAIPSLPVVLDSPMATKAMSVCLDHAEDQVLDSAFHGSENPFLPSRFEVATSPDESLEICMRDGPMIVISASGMLTGGRVLHHLKRRLPVAENTVMFTGYQADGTKGRYLQEQGAKEGTVRIHHEEVAVAAEIVTLHHLSSHVDRKDVVDYLDRMQKLPERIFVNHGEPAAQAALAELLRGRFKVDVVTAATSESLELW